MRKPRRCAVFVVLLAMGLAPRWAHADAGRAWSSARICLPRDTAIVAGIDMATIRKTTLFQQVVAPFLQGQTGVPPVLDRLGQICGITMMSAVQGVVIGTDKDGKQGAAFVSLQGIDQAQIEARIAKAGPGAGLSMKKDGSVWELSVEGKGKVYAGWADKDVIVLPLDPGDKVQLRTWMGGKSGIPTSGDLGSALAKVGTGSAVWVVVNKSQPLDQGITMRLGYGALDMAAGVVSADLHLRLSSARDATAAADKASKQIAEASKAGKIPPSLAKVLQGLKVAALGDELSAQASLPERDLLAIVSMLRGGK